MKVLFSLHLWETEPQRAEVRHGGREGGREGGTLISLTSQPCGGRSCGVTSLCLQAAVLQGGRGGEEKVKGEDRAAFYREHEECTL